MMEVDARGVIIDKHTIIVYRNERGIGDACMLLPTITKLSELNPDSDIIVVMDRPASAVYENHPCVHEIVNVADFNIADYKSATFFNVSSCCLEYELHHTSMRCGQVSKSRFELFADACGVEWDGNSGHIIISEQETHHIRDRVFSSNRQFNDAILVGIVLRSAQEWRSYQHIRTVVEYFQRNPLFGGVARKIIPITIDHEQQVDGVFSTVDLDIRETISLISFLDIVVGPDTGPMHVAGSLGIPTLWICGPTNPNLRAKTYDKAHWIWKPCRDDTCWYNFCDHVSCLWNISPWSVARLTKRILKNVTA